MNKIDRYRAALLELGCEDEWQRFLAANSNLPGPRGNLELLAAFCQVASPALARRLARVTPEDAATNTPGEFLASCGTAALGRVVASIAATDDVSDDLEMLRFNSADPRWRVREAVAMALSAIGRADYARLVAIVSAWRSGRPLVQRAVAAALAEPDLLRLPLQVELALDTLDHITFSLANTPAAARRADDFRALRQGLGYCWSVVLAANLAAGWPRFERWFASRDRDVRWMLRENLRKNRLVKLAPDLIAAATASLMDQGAPS